MARGEKLTHTKAGVCCSRCKLAAKASASFPKQFQQREDIKLILLLFGLRQNATFSRLA